MDEVPSLIAEYIAAYNAGDIPALLACLSPDVHFVDRSGETITIETRGIDDFRRLAEASASAFASRCQTIKNCIAGPGHATLKIDFGATVAIDLPNGWRAGDEVRMAGVSLFTLADHHITEVVDIS